MPGKPLSSSNNTVIISIISVLVVGIMGCGMFLLIAPPGGPAGVAAITTRGERIFVVRLPRTTMFPQQQITVYSDRAYPQPRIAVLTSMDEANTPIQLIQLTRDQWEAVEHLRQSWCTKLPNHDIAKEDKPFYDIGIRCESPSIPLSARIMIPSEQLPPELHQLLDLFDKANK